MEKKLQRIEDITKRIKLYKESSDIDIFKQIAEQDIYDSTHIEGNTLTYQETMALLATDVDSLRRIGKDEDEVLSYKECWDMILSGNLDSVNIDLNFIIELHLNLLCKSKPEEAGYLRKGTMDVVFIMNSDTELISGDEVEVKLIESIDTLQTNLKYDLVNPIVAIARFKQEYIHIHPFFDGNGRSSRLLMNILLMKCGYYPFAIKLSSRQSYFNALHDSIQEDNLEIFEEWFIDEYCNYLEELLSKVKGIKDNVLKFGG